MESEDERRFAVICDENNLVTRIKRKRRKAENRPEGHEGRTYPLE